MDKRVIKLAMRFSCGSCIMRNDDVDNGCMNGAKYPNECRETQGAIRDIAIYTAEVMGRSYARGFKDGESGGGLP